MIITLAMIKGGVAKSTLCTNLAVSLSKEGHKVKVLDLDHKNKGSFNFFVKRQKKGITGIQCQAIYSADELSEAMDYEGILLIDTGAFDDDLTRAVISISDQLVVPFNPRSDKDAEAFMSFLDTLGEIETIREQAVPTHLVATMIHPLRSTKQITDDIDPIINGNILFGGIMTRRASYENSGFDGNSVFDTRDYKAQNEIMRLCEKITKEI